ncbi:MAG: PQQ-dependent sugar dehydrogenase, partial [Proteobacteria bacterium]|nr:PQQ-dependent sugar dehydrogenase [Pseudomonadota bacterium]
VPAKCEPTGSRACVAPLEPQPFPRKRWRKPRVGGCQTAALFPQWRSNMFNGALAGRALWCLTLVGDGLVAPEALFAELGERIRDVRQGHDGALYLLTDDEAGRIVRIHT